MTQKFVPTKEQRAASSPTESVWVSANAGSGKTHVLVERVVRLLLEGADPSAILCITYTKAAASEMSARLYKRMSNWAIIDDDALKLQLADLGLDATEPAMLNIARRLFARALETPGGLKIQTIHAFCEKLLQQFPVEAGMTPGFRVLDDRQSKALLTTAISEVLRMAEAGRDEALATAFDQVVSFVSSDGFEYLMRQFLDGAKGLKQVLSSNISQDQYALLLKNSFGLNEWDSLVSSAEELDAIDRSAYAHHANILVEYKKFGQFDTVASLRAVAEPTSSLEDLRELFFTKGNEVRGKLIAKQTGLDHPVTLEFLESEKQRISEVIQKHDLLLRIEATANAFQLAKNVFQKIEQHKKFNAQYDFDDLIMRTANLVSSLRATQWVLYKLDAGLKHILVDEAQDTSPAQWQIISALCTEFFSGAGRPKSEDRTIFVVGDRKQSIYSFQGADVQALAGAKKFLGERINGTGKNLSDVDLSVSYRSTQTILDAVDLVFPVTQPALFGFATEDILERPHQSSRVGFPGIFELWPLVESGEDGESLDHWTLSVDREPNQSPRRLLAKLIADKIKSWIGCRIIKARGRLVEPSDILILLQSRGPLFSMLIAELRKRGVPVAGADRLQLLNSLVIQDLLILLQWLILPRDDYALACLLKSPLVPKPISEDELIDLAIGRGTSSLWSKLETANTENTHWLHDLQSRFAYMGPYAFFAHILTKFRKAMAMRLGSESIDASDAFLDQAMAYEIENGQSLVGFLHWFQASETSIKREMEKTSGEVRLMTIHGAKGLEANIVFLADAASYSKGDQSKPKLFPVSIGATGTTLPIWAVSHLSESAVLKYWKVAAELKDKAEHNRLLYVAMTRACDELYVCGIKTEKKVPEESWYAMVQRAVGTTLTTEFDWVGNLQTARRSETSKLDEMPAWAKLPASPETVKSIYGLTHLIKRNAVISSQGQMAATKRGTALHTLLQTLPSIELNNRKTYAMSRASRMGIEESDALELVDLIVRPDLEEFFGVNSQAEVELRGFLTDGREVSGRVDRLVIGHEEILILDHKTDRMAPKEVDASHPYVKQMGLYAHLLQSAYPGRSVRAALLWTQNSELMWIPQAFLTESIVEVVSEIALEAP